MGGGSEAHYLDKHDRCTPEEELDYHQYDQTVQEFSLPNRNK